MCFAIVVEERGVTHAGLAEAMGVNRSTVWRWVNGKSVPSAAMVSKLADYLGIGAGELLRCLLRKKETADEEKRPRPADVEQDSVNTIFRFTIACHKYFASGNAVETMLELYDEFVASKDLLEGIAAEREAGRRRPGAGKPGGEPRRR